MAMEKIFKFFKKIPIWVYILVAIYLIVEVIFAVTYLKLGNFMPYRDRHFLVHLFAVINLQFMMFVGSYYIYYRFAAAFPDTRRAKIVPNRYYLMEEDTRRRSTDSSINPRVSRRETMLIAMGIFTRVMLLIFLLLAHGSSIYYMVHLTTEVSPMGFITTLALGAYLHILLFLVFFDICLIILYFFQKTVGKVRIFGLKGFLNNHSLKEVLLTLGLTVIFVGYGLYNTMIPPTLVHEEVITAKLSSGSELNIVLLSDIHIGPSVGKKRVERIVSDVNKLNADVIAISGDLADGFVADLGEAAAPLCNMKSKYGIYFATGNHEYFHGEVDEWIEFLEECNVTVLHNQNQRLRIGDEDTVCLAGIDDLITLKIHHPGHKMDAKKALTGCKKEDLVVLLAHQPNAAWEVLQDEETNQNLDIILSGHTHDGQFFFVYPLTVLGNKYNHGRYRNDPTNTEIFVSAGVNFFGPPIRSAGFCEIVQIIVKGQESTQPIL